MLDNQQIQKNDDAKTKVLTEKAQGMTGKNDIENRPATAPAGEAGLRTEGTESVENNTIETATDESFIKLNNDKSNTKFTAPDEFYPTQDPSPSREDITLGRGNSSATTKSTAQAESISSEVSSNDAKKKN